MAMFYFHFRTGDEIAPDLEGFDLPDLHAAREEAIKSAREIVSCAIKSGRADPPDHIVIADHCGREVATVALADMVPERLRK
jgi:hypothetical protein